METWFIIFLVITITIIIIEIFLLFNCYRTKVSPQNNTQNNTQNNIQTLINNDEITVELKSSSFNKYTIPHIYEKENVSYTGIKSISNLQNNTLYELNFNDLALNFMTNNDGEIYFNNNKDPLPVYCLQYNIINLYRFADKNFETPPKVTFVKDNRCQKDVKPTTISMPFDLVKIDILVGSCQNAKNAPDKCRKISCGGTKQDLCSVEYMGECCEWVSPPPGNNVPSSHYVPSSPSSSPFRWINVRRTITIQNGTIISFQSPI